MTATTSTVGHHHALPQIIGGMAAVAASTASAPIRVAQGLDRVVVAVGVERGSGRRPAPPARPGPIRIGRVRDVAARAGWAPRGRQQVRSSRDPGGSWQRSGALAGALEGGRARAGAAPGDGEVVARVHVHHPPAGRAQQRDAGRDGDSRAVSGLPFPVVPFPAPPFVVVPREPVPDTAVEVAGPAAAPTRRCAARTRRRWCSGAERRPAVRADAGVEVAEDRHDQAGAGDRAAVPSCSSGSGSTTASCGEHVVRDVPAAAEHGPVVRGEPDLVIGGEQVLADRRGERDRGLQARAGAGAPMRARPGGRA